MAELIPRDDTWLVRREWYSDPLAGDSVAPAAPPASTVPAWISELVASWQPEAAGVVTCPPDLPSAEISGAVPSATTGAAGRYNREAAVRYADTYCGTAAGCGNNRRYNQKYRDYTAKGGDCANFASQVLGDPEAGGLPMTSTWRYQYNRREGSTAWISASCLAQYLRNSGRARLVAHGTYGKVTAAMDDQPGGAISTLQPGDLIAYEEKGDVVHFAVVTALDTHGMPLVNSHTADRYHVPWDLGWNEKTVYWLFQIRG